MRIADLTSLADSLEPLTEQFNHQADRLRLLVVVSPT